MKIRERYKQERREEEEKLKVEQIERQKIAERQTKRY